MAKELFLSTQQAGKFLKLKQSGVWPELTVEEKPREKGNNQEVRFLTHLRHREYWAKLRGANKPIKQHTFDMPEMLMITGLRKEIARLRDASGQNYGRLITTVRAELEKRRKPEMKNANSNTPNPEGSIPLWEE